MSFSVESLIPRLPVLKTAPRLLVAYSGGLDSHVLLHSLAQLRNREADSFRLEALHVHHGISAEADDWVGHCETICQRLAVPLRIRYVEQQASAASLENQLRKARYRIFEEELGDGELLALAHHADDQAETLLLRMLRGAGPKGLGGMPETRPLGGGCLVRPLLGFTRADLEVYARQHQLSWVEDDSNTDTGIDRNYLRHEVMPKLAERWPQVTETFARNAQVNAEADAVLTYFLQRELAAEVSASGGGLGCDWLQGYPSGVQHNLLRSWLQAQGLPLPGYRHLQQALDEVVGAARDAKPLLSWPGVELRRYQGVLYASRPLGLHDAQACLNWRLPDTLDLLGAGSLEARLERGQGVRIPQDARVTVRFRQGGERCRIAGQSRLLKKQLQAWQVAPWLRDRVPLLYVNGELAAVADLCICEGFQAREQQQGFVVKWCRP